MIRKLFLGLSLACFAAAPTLLVAQEKEKVVVEKGAEAPDFTMTGIDGKEFKLSDRMKDDRHIVLMFSRASW